MVRSARGRRNHRRTGNGERSFPCRWVSERDGREPANCDDAGGYGMAAQFSGIDQDGITSIVRTTGNPTGACVLRWRRSQSNYDATSIREAEAKFTQAALPTVLMVDCSYAPGEATRAAGGSVHDVVEQRAGRTRSLIGLMVKAQSVRGQPAVSENLAELHMGVDQRRLLWAGGRDGADDAGARALSKTRERREAGAGESLGMEEHFPRQGR